MKKEINNLQALLERIGKVVIDRNWDKSWASGGCYIHLEVSEFIEALRGKGDTSAAEEAGDILVSLFAVLDWHKIPLSDVVASAEAAITKLEQDPNFGKQGDI